MLAQGGEKLLIDTGWPDIGENRQHYGYVLPVGERLIQKGFGALAGFDQEHARDGTDYPRPTIPGREQAGGRPL